MILPPVDDTLRRDVPMLEEDGRRPLRVDVKDVRNAQDAAEIAEIDHLALPAHWPWVERRLHEIVVLLVMAPAEEHQIFDPALVAVENASRVLPDPVRAPVVMLVARVVGDQLVR